MCVLIEWQDKGIISTQGELADVTSEWRVRRHLGASPFEPDTCLCPVDVASVLSLEDVAWQRNDGIPEYEVSTDE
jgi:hypothetical protein